MHLIYPLSPPYILACLARGPLYIDRMVQKNLGPAYQSQSSSLMLAPWLINHGTNLPTKQTGQRSMSYLVPLPPSG